MRNYRKFKNNINYNSISQYGIVLDLDETLIKSEKYNIKLNSKIYNLLLKKNRIFTLKLIDCDATTRGKGEVEYMKVIKRYGLSSFLEWCYIYFRVVIVFSAGLERYVEAIVDNIFDENRHPYLVFHRDHCNYDKGYTIKNLKDLYDYDKDLINIVPLSKLYIIDDNPYTFENNVENGIKIKKFNPLRDINNILEDDNELNRVKKHLISITS